MKIYFLIFICLFSLSTKAQKVALVLSGGGAKGLAHAGVLKALEENNIPIDYVVGTSMGSVVGGFYAAGYSPEQIKELALSEDLQNWVDGIIDEDYRYSFKEQTPDPSWLTIKLDFDSDFDVSLDATLDRDYVLNINLAEKLQYASYVSQGNYNNLFVPFRPVASNIFTEQEVVLDSGVLYESVRASMAIPLLYRPVRINGELLFDGGVYNNFPITPAREAFNPDVIIGVNVGSKVLEEYPKDDDEKLLAESILFFMLNKGDPSLLHSTDVFVDVKLAEFSTLDFIKAKEIYDQGYQTTMTQMDEIKRKIKGRVSQEEIYIRRQNFLNQTVQEKFDTLIVEGFNKKKSDYLNNVFNKNEPFDIKQAKSAYYRLIDNDYFLNIFPSYETEEKYAFRLSGQSNPRLKTKIGGSLTSRNISYLYLGLDFKRLSRVLEQYTTDIFLGPFYESFKFSGTIALPGEKTFSFGPKVIINHRDYLNLADYLLGEPDLTVMDRTDRKFGIYFGFPINRKVGFSMEASYLLNKDKFSNQSQINTSDDIDELELSGWRIEAQVSHDNFNFRQFASKGSKLDINVSQFLLNYTYSPGSTSSIEAIEDAQANWFRVKLSSEKYYYFGPKYSLGGLMEGVYSNQPVIGTLKSSVMNFSGFYPLQDSHTLMLENFRSRRYLAVGIKNVWSPYKNFQFRLEGYVFNSGEDIIGEDGEAPRFETEWINPKYAATTGVVYQSLVGSVGFHVNYYDDVQHQWGALLQIGFLLFHDHSLE